MIIWIAIMWSIMAVVAFVLCINAKIEMNELDCQYWYCDCCLDYNESDMDICPKCGNKRC